MSCLQRSDPLRICRTSTYFLIERTKKMLARKKSSLAPKVIVPQKAARIDVLIINFSCRYIFIGSYLSVLLTVYLSFFLVV